MPKKLRVTLMVCGGVLLVIAVGLAAVYWASQQVPELYLQALEVQREDSDEMVGLTIALISDVKQKDRWLAQFTAEQINGWLEFDLVENYPGLLPDALLKPRVAIEQDRMMVFCRVRYGNFSSVVTLTVEPYLPERPNVLALRICKVRAGAGPCPLGLKKILEGIGRLARRADIQLEWQQANGDPVAMITIPPPGGEADKLVQIETLQLEDGIIYLAGTTKRRKR